MMHDWPASGSSRPGISNLVAIHAAISGQTPEAIAALFEGKGYGAFKTSLSELVVEYLKPVREAYTRIAREVDMVDRVLQEGAQRARRLCEPTLRDVYDKVGFI